MEVAKKTIKELFQIIGIDILNIEIKKDNPPKGKELLIINIEINPKDAQYFLKEKAEGLTSLQRIARILISKRDLNQRFLLLDINKYRKEREDFLTELALKTVKKVRRTKKPIILESMPAYERRFVHLKLAEQPDIVTESIGEEPERRVVIRLYP